MTESTEPQQLHGTPIASRPGYFRRADGIIVDKNGKPCRTCNSYKDLAAASRMFTSGASKAPSKATAAAAAATTAATVAAAAPVDSYYNTPPPDVEELGRASWTLLHSLAATYPQRATDKEQQQMRGFMGTFARVYPCGWCAADFREWMARDENRVEKHLAGRREFGNWMCRAHNDVNEKLGKKQFDCLRWMERWGGGEE
ncbi:augmenter of liver regeneration [Geopyxis carbonaria]|nr:augmenter of liver regeneration [Geopyxis carbonaria]